MVAGHDRLSADLISVFEATLLDISTLRLKSGRLRELLSILLPILAVSTDT